MKLQNSWKHFKTITYHKHLVMKGCFKVGLYKQGLLHDMSKYSPSEFLVGAHYFQGHRSPNNAEREEKGYSSAWLHHKGRNKHHYEYWFDYTTHGEIAGISPVPMPVKYVVEMFMDRIAACKVYDNVRYTDQSPLHYYLSGKNLPLLHEQTQESLELLLNMLARDGEEKTVYYIKHSFLKRNNPSQKANRKEKQSFS